MTTNKNISISNECLEMQSEKNINSNFTQPNSSELKNNKNKPKTKNDNPIHNVNKDLIKCDRLIFGEAFNESKINFKNY